MKRGVIETVLGLGILLIMALSFLMQAQANKQASLAARIAASGQTVSGVIIAFLVGVLAVILLIGGSVIAYLWWRLKRLRSTTTRQWRSNSGNWHSQGTVEKPDQALRQVTTEETQGTLETLVQLEVLRALRGLHNAPSQPVLPYNNEGRAKQPGGNNEEAGWFWS